MHGLGGDRYGTARKQWNGDPHVDGRNWELQYQGNVRKNICLSKQLVCAAITDRLRYGWICLKDGNCCDRKCFQLHADWDSICIWEPAACWDGDVSRYDKRKLRRG